MKTTQIENPLVIVVEVSLKEIEDFLIETVLKHLDNIGYTRRELISYQAEISMEGIHTVTLSYKDYIEDKNDES